MFDIAYLNHKTIEEYNKTRDRGSQSQTASQETSLNSVQRAFAFHDTLTRFIFPLCTSLPDRPDPEKPISSAVYLVNVSSFGLKQAWQLRTYAQDISRLLAISFPEVVDTVFVSDAFVLVVRQI